MSEFIAVDLGATSGRVAIGKCDSNSFTVEVVHRFDHEVIQELDKSLLWNFEHIFDEVIKGLKKAASITNPISVSIDSWAVDYGFINNGLTGPVRAYRDPRNLQSFEELTRKIGKDRIYSTTGIQFLPFNTIYQLNAARKSEVYKDAKAFLMIPDLINMLLTGVVSTEVTNASSTQLLNTTTRKWDFDLIKAVEIRNDIFTKLHEPGTFIGEIRNFQELDGLKVIATASHDTASAIASINFSDRNHEGFISSGTWSLIGIERTSPLKSSKAYSYNFTNELGAEGTVRVLKNLTGMWLLEECRRTWSKNGTNYSIKELLALAKVSSIETLINPNDPTFDLPDEMPYRIAEYCSKKGFQVPTTPGEFTFVILNSLAHSYKEILNEIEILTENSIKVLHIIGGGSQNELLNQLTSKVCGVEVRAGAMEATLYGNIAIQAIAAGVYKNLNEARTIISKSLPRKYYYPK